MHIACANSQAFVATLPRWIDVSSNDEVPDFVSLAHANHASCSGEASALRGAIVIGSREIMPSWTFVPLDYEPLHGSSHVFVEKTDTFDVLSLKKGPPARDTKRQKHFEDQVRNVAWHLGSRIVPVYVDFNGSKRRMDKGCIGIAVASGFIEQPENGSEGYLSHVTLAGE